jgi:plastocyanin
MTDKNVTIKNFKYIDAEIEIMQGDKVIWTSQDDAAHTVTADDGSFDSGDIVRGDPPFEFVFKNVGEFKYHCDHHGIMKGKVTVAAASNKMREKPY